MDPNNYWEKRYQTGGKSGPGSIGTTRTWKWKIINKYITKLDNVVDVGCGDLSFWDGKDCNNYIGIDISPYIIEKNKKKRPHWHFICGQANNYFPNVKGDIIFCFDVLIHILNEDNFQSILKNLTSYSNEWIFLSSWNKNPFASWDYRFFLFKNRQFGSLVKSLTGRLVSDNRYQKYRDFFKYIPLFRRKGFRLVGRELANSIGALFVFRRET